MKDKKTLIFGIVFTTLVVVSVVGLTYAFFTAEVFGNDSANEEVIETADLRLVFTDTQLITMEGALPGQSETKTFTVENTGTASVDYTINIIDVVNTFVGDELVYTLTNDKGLNIENTPLPREDKELVTMTIAPEEVQTYTLRVTFLETGSDQNSNQGAIFGGRLYINSTEEYTAVNGLGIVALYVDNQKVSKLDITKYYNLDTEKSYCDNGEKVIWDTLTRTISVIPIDQDTNCKVYLTETEYLALKDQMIKDNKDETTGKVLVDTEEGINFGAVSSDTNGKGLYQTGDLTKTEGGEPVYYYRGAVENNYVIFGDYCWRIVRTNEDGSVRLRFGGTLTNGVCPQTGTAVNIGSSVYYTAANNKSYVNYKTSTIKGVIENWYKTNIYYKSDGLTENTSLTNLVADSPYCNDMTEPIVSNYFGANNRLVDNKTPQYKCSSSTYAYTVEKGDLTYPVGLLTADEIAYAGGGIGENKSFYLYTGENYWTMTPYGMRSTYADMFVVSYLGVLGSSGPTYSFSTIPVISLKLEAKVSEGTGVYNDPYIIITN